MFNRWDDFYYAAEDMPDAENEGKWKRIKARFNIKGEDILPEDYIILIENSSGPASTTKGSANKRKS